MWLWLLLDFMAVLESSAGPLELSLDLRLFPGTEKAEGAWGLLGLPTRSCRDLCKHGAAWGRGRLLNEGSSSVAGAPLRAGAEWRPVPGPSWGSSVQMGA